MKNALTNTMSALPTQLARSLTWDRGKEMPAHAQFRIESGLVVFFADPQSQWHRGRNENTNGLLRQYFPKGTDLARWGAEEIEAVAHALNSRPRKSPGWKTPAEAFNDSYCYSNKAVLQRPVESDQYTPWLFGHRLRRAGLLGSMGRVASSVDNALIESFWSTMQRELLDRTSRDARVQLASATFEWIEGFHNPRRRHTSLGDLSPADYEALHAAAGALPEHAVGPPSRAGVCLIRRHAPADRRERSARG